MPLLPLLLKNCSKKGAGRGEVGEVTCVNEGNTGLISGDRLSGVIRGIKRGRGLDPAAIGASAPPLGQSAKVRKKWYKVTQKNGENLLLI